MLISVPLNPHDFLGPFFEKFPAYSEFSGQDVFKEYILTNFVRRMNRKIQPSFLLVFSKT